MLPFFFRHYDPIVDHYFIYDNQSTDGSLDILRAHPRVTILPLVIEGDSYVESAIVQVNRFWHPSRGNADWVAVCNIDEFFWHIDLAWYLRKCRSKGITFLKSVGYQMVSERFPAPTDDLAKAARSGVRANRFDKPAFFNPDAITETRFEVGRHACQPQGQVVFPRSDEIYLLHYKYLGLDYVTKRHAELNARRRPRDVERRYGQHYEADSSYPRYTEFWAGRREVVPPDQSGWARARRRWWGPGIRPLKPPLKIRMKRSLKASPFYRIARKAKQLMMPRGAN
jgi:hypothetical protein